MSWWPVLILLVAGIFPGVWIYDELSGNGKPDWFALPVAIVGGPLVAMFFGVGLLYNGPI